MNRTLAEQLAKHLADRICRLETYLDTGDAYGIRVKRVNVKPYFYLRIPGRQQPDQYISAGDSARYRRYARKIYSKKVIPAMKKDLNALRRFLSDYSWKSEADLAGSLDPELVRLCGEGFASRDTIISDWLSQTWTETPPSGNAPDRPTVAGYCVRSKSEEFIANALFNHEQYFFYEKPLYLKTQNYPLFPDFTILKRDTLEEVYWEHFGLIDNPVYAEQACRKILAYIRAGFVIGKNLIVTFETSGCPLSSMDVEQIIKQYLE